MTGVTRAWIGLILLFAATTLVSLGAMGPPVAGLLILAIAWAKARLIFLWYLDLADVPQWRTGILFALGLFIAVLFGLYLAAGGSGGAQGLG